MLWHLIIDADTNDQLSASITVEADDWFSALRQGLDKQGVDGNALASLSSKVAPDNSVHVTDIITRRTYLLRPVIDAKESPVVSVPTDQPAAPIPPLSETGMTSDIETAISAHIEQTEPLPKPEETTAKQPDLPEHTLFFSRDERHQGGGDIFYRERLIAVAPSLQKEAAMALIRHYFSKLQELNSPEGTKLYITIHIYDHLFKVRSERPAIVALTWKAWRPEKPEILFPLSGDEGVTFSKIPPAKPEADTFPPQTPVVPVTAVQEVNASPRGRAHTSRAEQSDAVGTTALGIDDRMVTAFERIQEIYALRDHDAVASLILSIARGLIPCEAGFSMLVSPGESALYVAAAEGPIADQMLGRSHPLGEGLVGFAIRNGVAMNVEDPANDPRFENALAKEAGSNIRNVLCAPAQFEGATVGVIELFNSVNTSGFTESEGHILSYLSTNLAEYVCTSLPSREADFTDSDFHMPLRKKRSTKKKAPAKKADGKATKVAAPTDSTSASAQKKKGVSPTAATKKKKEFSKPVGPAKR